MRGGEAGFTAGAHICMSTQGGGETAPSFYRCYTWHGTGQALAGEYLTFYTASGAEHLEHLEGTSSFLPISCEHLDVVAQSVRCPYLLVWSLDSTLLAHADALQCVCAGIASWPRVRRGWAQFTSQLDDHLCRLQP